MTDQSGARLERNETTSRVWSRTTWGLAGLVVFGFVVLGGLFPDADPPTWLPGHLDDRIKEFFVEGPAKAHEARNWALFGEFHRNPADNYQFWRPQAPVWVYPLAATFRVFGTSWATLRLFTLFLATGGLVATMLLLRRLVPPAVVLGVATLYATSVFATFLSRSGHIEVLLGSASALIIALLVPGRRHPGWLVASQIAFTLGFFAKQGMAYLFPLLVVANVLAFARWVRDGRFVRLRWLPVLTAVGVAGLAALVIVQPEYLRTISWNADHVLGSRGSSWWTPDATRVWRTWGTLAPGVGGVAALGWFLLVGKWLRERRVPWAEGLVVAWASSAWLATMALRTWTVRHASIVLLPTFVLAAVVYARVAAGRRRWPRHVLIGLAVAVLGLHLWHQGRRFQRMTWSRQAVEAKIERHIGDEPAVVVGRFAMPVLLGTNYDVYYVKFDFNTAPERLRALEPDFLLRARNGDAAKQFLEMAGFTVGRRLARVRTNRYSLELYPLTPP